LPCKPEKTMSRRPDRNYQPAFKANVTLEAAKKEVTTVELSSKYDVRPNQINQWKLEPLELAAEIFDPQKSSSPPVEVKILQAKIAQLTLENVF